MVLEPDVTRLQVERSCDQFDVVGRSGGFRQAGNVELGKGGCVLAQDNRAAHGADLLLQNNNGILLARNITEAFRCQQDGGTDGRVSGERQFHLGCEDPHGGGMPGLFRREDEDRFGKIELTGDLLHLLVAQPLGVQNHRQGVPGKARVREDIQDRVAAAHTSLLPVAACRPSNEVRRGAQTL